MKCSLNHLIVSIYFKAIAYVVALVVKNMYVQTYMAARSTIDTKSRH